ncbi:unnamed protein product [Mycena citricolor]|uniref:Uncharacterized protein n=1 Tax=Mycena citricolor TaxID=2018698 RepID=A0AAD2H0D1_9AGAR|nr:unnamed protein product [Mycena citricolor]
MVGRRISGCVPGILDPQQPGRLLRRLSSSLSFASFDPRVASSHHALDLRTLSLNEQLYRPKRIVIETTSSGESCWRFVPNARRDPGVPDEGQWPRVVDICGDVVECTQDQWDIYKLDPAYHCLVRALPALTTITLAPPPSEYAPPLRPSGVKHRLSSPEPHPDMPPAKAPHIAHESDEEAEVEMIVDDDGSLDVPWRSVDPGRLGKRYREDLEKNRKERREKGARRVEKLSAELGAGFFFGPIDSEAQNTAVDATGKRKAASLFDSFKTQEDPDYWTLPEEVETRNAPNYSPAKASKRTRTFSPNATKRDLETRRLEREKHKRQRRAKELRHRTEKAFQNFMHGVYAEVPNANPMSNPVSESDEEDSEDEQDEECIRAAAIAESRRKMAELEADRPLWQAAAKLREHRQREDEIEKRNARERERQAAEARKAEQERQSRMEEERARAREEARVREERAKRERERRKRDERWAYGSWSPLRALDRYQAYSKVFDSTRFSSDEPLTFDVVPWPDIDPPGDNSFGNVSWRTVETFFNTIKCFIPMKDYITLVDKSRKRFHPDRWSSRGLLKTVQDDAERQCLEIAANTVAQALTPLWQDITDR